MVSWGSAVITALPCPSSCVAAESAWESADTVWSISTAFVSGWELVVVALPKLAANRKVSLAWVPVPAGDADAVWVVALCVESLVAACVFVVVLAAAGDADAVWAVAPACVPLLVESAVFGWGFVSAVAPTLRVRGFAAGPGGGGGVSSVGSVVGP